MGKAIAGKELRELLIEAIRYGEEPEVKARLVGVAAPRGNRVVADKLDHNRLQQPLEERVLVRDAIDASKVLKVRADMERAQARRLQPHFIASFFLEAFGH